MVIKSSGDVSISLHANKLFGELLEDEAITEIAINRPGEIFFEKNGVWYYQEAAHITYDLCDSFARALAKYRSDYIGDMKPILSAVLPDGERTQVITPPACERETISITVRKPNKSFFDLDYYINNGFFSRVIKTENRLSDDDRTLLEIYHKGDYAEFLKQAVICGKNIVIAGETGSGKTTLMKALVDYIPLHERLGTIEDTDRKSVV